jgi:hypothetical protein
VDVYRIGEGERERETGTFFVSRSRWNVSPKLPLRLRACVMVRGDKDREGTKHVML